MHRIISIAYIFLFTLIFNSCSYKEEESLIGRWESATKPFNLGATLIFEEDSSFTEIKEARVKYSYKLVGDTLISTSFSGLTGEKIIDSANVVIFQDTLILVRGKIGDQQETIMKRYDSLYTNTNGIIGFWKWAHQSGREAISEYHPDGKAAVSVLIDRRKGHYFTKGDSLTIVMPGTTLRDVYFELKGDSLFFPDKFAPLGKIFYRVKHENNSAE
jgi:hypothetical protein